MRKLLLALLFAPALLHAQSLTALVHAAMDVDPAITAAEAQLRAAEQRLTQAKAGFGPTINGNWNTSRTRYTDKLPADAVLNGRGVREFQSKTYSIEIKQPVLNNAIYYAYVSAEAQVDQARGAVEQARAESQEKFVEACFEVLKSRDDVRFLQSQKSATIEQLATAQHSFKTGTAAIPDVREAQAKADTVAAQLVAAQFDLQMRQEVVDELEGAPVVGLDRRGLDGTRMPRLEAASLLEWLSDAAVISPQIQQAIHALDAAEADALKAGQGHAPTIEASGNYTRGNETGSETSMFPRIWQGLTATITLNVPLYAGGATQAHVVEALALRDKARSDLEAARRSVSLAVRQDFIASLSAVSQAQGLDSAVKSNEVALAANKRGYQVGMKINAEVLDAQQKLFEARRNLSKARYDAWLNFIKLNAVAGRLDEMQIALLDAVLVSQVEAPPGEKAPARDAASKAAKAARATPAADPEMTP
jgi:outer membrane protein